MTNDEGSTNDRITKQESQHRHRHSGFVIPSSLDIGHSSFRSAVIATDAQLEELVRKINAADRVAVDTEADSLHSYREKLCLIQISAPEEVIPSEVEESRGSDVEVIPRCASPSLSTTVSKQRDFVVDPLSNLDLEPLRHALESREIVLHAADYDLRMLRRGLHFRAITIFDTVIASRLLGIREFSLGSLVKRFFGI